MSGILLFYCKNNKLDDFKSLFAKLKDNNVKISGTMDKCSKIVGKKGLKKIYLFLRKNKLANHKLIFENSDIDMINFVIEANRDDLYKLFNSVKTTNVYNKCLIAGSKLVYKTLKKGQILELYKGTNIDPKLLVHIAFEIKRFDINYEEWCENNKS